MATYLKKQKNAELDKNTGDNGEEGAKEGADGEEGHKKNGSEEIDEELLLEMCRFSNSSTANNQLKSSGLNCVARKNGGLQSGSGKTKNIVEDYDIDLEGDTGTDGRPRVREEVKLPPQYESIDLNDPNDEVLFQGELVKFKAGYNPAFLNRWLQVTEKAFKYYKNRCNAVTCCNKPLQAIPIAAIKKVEKVSFDLKIGKKDAEKYAEYNQNQFEVYLKDDFIEIFVRPDYEQKQTCNHTHANSKDSPNALGQSHLQSPSKVTAFSSSQQMASTISSTDRLSSPRKVPTSSPGKVRGFDGVSHDMTAEEMKYRFHLQEQGFQHSKNEDKHTKSVNIQGSWSNREEEWYFNNKRLLFAAKNAEIRDQWVEKLNALVTE